MKAGAICITRKCPIRTRTLIGLTWKKTRILKGPKMIDHWAIEVKSPSRYASLAWESGMKLTDVPACGNDWMIA